MNKFTANWIDEHKDELISTLQKTISFNTTENKKTAGPGAPFGKDNAGCLEYVLDKAAGLGFETKNLDGYCGCVDFGEGEELLAILAHLDVVPEGNGWTYPPYGGEIHDGCIWGRGTLDDKGPAIEALYALAAVKASDLPFKRRVRIILGCNEESGMECLEHYNKVEEEPDMAFSPDAEYPLINSEKTIYGSGFQKAYASKLRVKGGTVGNAVCGECGVFVPLDAENVKTILSLQGTPEGFGIEVSPAEGGANIHITGKAAHSSTPEEGKNAFYAALDILIRMPLAKDDFITVKYLKDYLGFYLHGEGFGIDQEDSSGRLTMNCGVIDWDETGIKRLSVDIRAPISADCELISKKLAEGFGKAGLACTGASWSIGYYQSPDSEIVQKLMKVYDDYFHDGAKPLAIGGGTYARHLKNAVAFGPERKGEENPIHMANERIKIENLIEDAKIYADAIIELACK